MVKWSSISLENPGFMALAPIALEKQSLTRKLDRKLPSQGTLKSRSPLFIDDRAIKFGQTCILKTRGQPDL